jgi:excisionase family DNA binding protein
VLTLLDAARRVGMTKGAVLKAIRRGKLSAIKDGQGHWRIDPAELTRAYDLGAPGAPPSADTGAPEVRERLARAEAMWRCWSGRLRTSSGASTTPSASAASWQGKALALNEDRRGGAGWWRRLWRS